MNYFTFISACFLPVLLLILNYMPAAMLQRPSNRNVGAYLVIFLLGLNYLQPQPASAAGDSRLSDALLHKLLYFEPNLYLQHLGNVSVPFPADPSLSASRSV
jgi:hypothetical protein